MEADSLKYIYAVLFSMILTGCEKSKILWVESVATDSNFARVTNVEYVTESCNSLTLDVSYYNPGVYHLPLIMEPFVDISDSSRRGTAPLKTGHHVQRLVAYSGSSIDQFTNEVVVRIKLADNDSGWKLVEARSFFFEKKWSSC